MVKSFLITIVLSLIVLLFAHCNRTHDVQSDNNKDLAHSMEDMMMYHDNLGTELRKGDADNASWLLEGMDSSLQVIAATLKNHQKLNAPFKKTYQTKLQPVIKDIRESLKENNFPEAIKAYRLLTNNCNTCHKEHDIDEKVFDLSDQSNN